MVLVGAISLSAAQHILHNAYKTREISRHIVTIDGIHADVFQYLLSIHHFLIRPDREQAEKSVSLLSDIEMKVSQYKEKEKSEEYKERTRVIELLDRILENLENEKKILPIFKEFSRTGAFDRDAFEILEKFAYAMETSIAEINRIHFNKIGEWEKESLKYMWNAGPLIRGYLRARGQR
ncbi:MAG: hypothetical protein HY758_02250 [Nitrospirae bacterium]|nr:hypothetical protein [Nitrospirota bacterium]